MFLFMAVGYAQLTDNLAINGTAEVKEIETVYITNLAISGSSNISVSGAANASLTKTGHVVFQHNNYKLLKQAQNGTAGGKIIIKVTVKNNSGKPQYLSELIPFDTNDSRYSTFKQSCTITYAESGENRKVENGQSKTYTITIQNKSSKDIDLNGFQTSLVFTPKLDVNDTKNATQALVKAFAYILAGKGPNGDETAKITFQGEQNRPKDYSASQIVSELLLKTTGNGGAMNDAGTGGYMGNVAGAKDYQKELIEDMFGEQITIEIGSNVYSVSVLIKNQQMDNSGDNDMVIYVTADQLFQGSGGWEESNRNNNWTAGYHNLNYVPVYALVFIKVGNTYQYCDHLFAGQAPVCDYGGAFGDGKTGNFNTNLWVSTEFNVKDSSANSNTVNKDYISADGALDEAYQYYIKQNPNAQMIPVTDLIKD